MSTLERIVPPLELCKQIPAGEFEDSVLVWKHHEIFFRGIDIMDQTDRVTFRADEQNDIVSTYSSTRYYPAPTLEEIMTSLLNYDGWLLKIDSRPGLETFVELYSKTSNKRYTEYAPSACEAALRLWFKVKGIEVE